MKKIHFSNEKITFGVPYFESFLYYYGEVIEQKGKSLMVRYSTEVEINKVVSKITHTTEIPNSYVVYK